MSLTSKDHYIKNECCSVICITLLTGVAPLVVSRVSRAAFAGQTTLAKSWGFSDHPGCCSTPDCSTNCHIPTLTLANTIGGPFVLKAGVATCNPWVITLGSYMTTCGSLATVDLARSKCLVPEVTTDFQQPLQEGMSKE